VPNVTFAFRRADNTRIRVNHGNGNFDATFSRMLSPWNNIKNMTRIFLQNLWSGLEDPGFIGRIILKLKFSSENTHDINGQSNGFRHSVIHYIYIYF
jgi:hypothetical protein